MKTRMAENANIKENEIQKEIKKKIVKIFVQILEKF